MKAIPTYEPSFRGFLTIFDALRRDAYKSLYRLVFTFLNVILFDKNSWQSINVPARKRQMGRDILSSILFLLKIASDRPDETDVQSVSLQHIHL